MILKPRFMDMDQKRGLLCFTVELFDSLTSQV